MTIIRNNMKRWIKKDECSINKPSSKPNPSTTASPPPSANSSSKSTPYASISSSPQPSEMTSTPPNTPFGTIKKASNDLHTKVAQEVASILKSSMETDIQKLSQTINEVKSSVAKEIDLAIGLKMANKIENRVKAEVLIRETKSSLRPTTSNKQHQATTRGAKREYRLDIPFTNRMLHKFWSVAPFLHKQPTKSCLHPF